jgi:excisionase family DNA binding protein
VLLKYGDIAKELCGIARELTDLAERLNRIEAATPEINLASGADQPQKTMLSVEEAGEMLGISRQLAYQLANRDDFPCLRIGRRMLIPRSKLIVWVDNHCGQEVIL